ncbi:polysaccharide export protein [Methylobacterium sp. 4-46]|uniref:polysaccharide biosynthesis/export family protein n=1 Tax=unclassified Methylobacterium TaxID=2615210 RepID=UPI000152C774|nr:MULTISPECIES: polysaccharide biosynthesis/export family protein [Methylobacterium]ACA14895.1 polysaccharide export protein [Methylobacterium sp. 4-46]WFT80635.1 polysaccharide export protein [Methylobacterium nodulans]
MVRVGPLAVAGAVLLSGCSNFLPAAGPTASAVTEGADIATDQGLLARYEIIDVDAAVVEALRGRPLDSLLASFGDRRAAVAPVIGIGDAVTVTIWEAGTGGLFSGPVLADRFSAGSKASTIPEQIVGRDGSISVPYAGRIQVAGKRVQEVQGQIEQELAGKAIQPQVLVTVTSPLSSSVTVIGEAASAGGGARLSAAALRGPVSSIGGGRVPLSERGDRLLDVIAAAGGVSAPVNETFVRLSRGPTTATVPLLSVVSNPRENIFLRPGDTVTLVRDPQTFLAIGALGTQSEIPFSADGITLAQALTKARGLSDFQADPAGVFVFRFEPASVVRRLRPGSPLLGSPQVPVVYRINMRDPNSLFVSQAFRMRNRDLVYVSNAPFTEVQKVLGAFSTVTAPVAAGASIYTVTR